MRKPFRIVGAGLSGLIAAHAWPGVPIIEAAPEPRPHRALLRFRSENVAHITGIEFRRVLVRKGLWSGGAFRRPTIALANAYARKVLGRVIGDRSIWNLAPVERWVAPEDFQERLLDNVRSRVLFDAPDDLRGDRPFISTVPLPAALQTLGIDFEEDEFVRAPIDVRRYRVANCDAHQTVYFPDEDLNLYRASITGDVLILESVAGQFDHLRIAEVIMDVFDIHLLSECAPLGSVKQEYGKIISLPDVRRRAILFELTTRHGLYSLGRFAQWRNILLDDVVNDVHVIKKLLQSDSYTLRKAAS
jgi:hypothetical protein